ncbi:MAG: peptidoglycan DD-metalloendopeptidase family protein [Chloroflexota bacterium]
MWLTLLVAVWGKGNLAPAAAQSPAPYQHVVLPGDTWAALAWRFDLTPAALQAANPHFNRQRQPTIGAAVLIPATESVERSGVLIRVNEGGLLQTAARYHHSPWSLSLANGFAHPFYPLLYRPLFLPGGATPPIDLPAGFHSLELSAVPSHPGEALAIRAQVNAAVSSTIQLAGRPFNIFTDSAESSIPSSPHPGRLVALGGTGAFFPPGDHELTVQTAGQPLWSQPWRMVDREWGYEQLTLTGAAAAIDQASIIQERARLFQIWNQASPLPLWDTPFQRPIIDYLEQSGFYGSRRSYNGGPYSTYHEGVDFSAWAGTPVYAPAGGTVVLAETLYVRGGAVIIDHGLGVYTGLYHLSRVLAQPGQVVRPGDPVGEVGTTGLSTGNHLHWDLLVAGTWVDAAVWLEQDIGCWVLAGLGRPCP